MMQGGKPAGIGRILMTKLIKKLGAVMISAVMALTFAPNTAIAALASGNSNSVMPSDSDRKDSVATVDDVINKMSMDEKISQMIIPAFRTFDNNNVTELDAFPKLKVALKKHQYGGIILFSQNITGTEQVTRLINDLQENNVSANASVHIPYLTTADEEGGIVIRLNSGTRMTGNMAIGATADAAANAEKTGDVLGEELAAAGFNTDFAPDIDVNNNPENPVIGTRSFSDDPATVAKLGEAYASGLRQNNIIATYKHFPGHGDTGTDSHIGTPSVSKTYEEISSTELVPFRNAIENGADMIMTAHITYPLIDDEVTFGDGTTKGFYPATMSKKMITEILRTDMGYNGVVVTDALEMAAIQKAGLVPGKEGSVGYSINIAEKVINAGVDILLLPTDLINDEAVAFYDDYISGIWDKVKAGEISEERINESVKRILILKEKYGIFDVSETTQKTSDIEEKVQKALQTVGSDAHHEIEMNIAKEAITLVKNDSGTLPLSKDSGNIVVLGRQKNDLTTIKPAIEGLMEKGVIDHDIDVTIDYYYDSSAEVKLHYTDEVKEKISKAGVVIGFSNASGNSVLNKTNPQNIALQTAIEDVHKAGGRFVLISQNLPYDAAVFRDADAIILAYLGSGLNIDPTQRTESGLGYMARNANILAAIDTVFGLNIPSGKLPVNVPEVTEQSDGTLAFSKENLYNRGFGLSYDYGSVAIHRLYNINSGEHFFTGKVNEKDYLFTLGWSYEGVACYAPESSETPVYRLYNPNAGDHHYTTDVDERDLLIEVGWNDEGIGWYSDENQGTPLYRLYNPNATGQYAAGAHHYTKDVEERDYLIAAGWNDEGIGWYGK